MKSTETLAQQAFLKKQRRRRLFVAACRVFLLLFLLILWESCARIGIIDDFIFSSPSRVAESLISMTMDRSLFLHTGITVAETLILDNGEQIQNLFAMTPYYWKTPESGSRRLAQTAHLETEIRFDFLIYRRK